MSGKKLVLAAAASALVSSLLTSCDASTKTPEKPRNSAASVPPPPDKREALNGRKMPNPGARVDQALRGITAGRLSRGYDSCKDWKLQFDKEHLATIGGGLSLISWVRWRVAANIVVSDLANCDFGWVSGTISIYSQDVRNKGGTIVLRAAFTDNDGREGPEVKYQSTVNGWDVFTVKSNRLVGTLRDFVFFTQLRGIRNAGVRWWSIKCNHNPYPNDGFSCTETSYPPDPRSAPDASRNDE